VSWYQSIGFELAASHEEEGRIDWAEVKFGHARIMFIPSTVPWHETTAALSLWIRTDRLDDLYAVLKRRQLEHARAVLAGETPTDPLVRFKGDLYTAFYGQREFGIHDPNGVELMFFQPL
jgi:uncharacterized glyoxalase superfamily protein PhnB